MSVSERRRSGRLSANLHVALLDDIAGARYLAPSSSTLRCGAIIVMTPLRIMTTDINRFAPLPDSGANLRLNHPESV
jgi:hypothetical protein